jgi:hypothetical protein
MFRVPVGLVALSVTVLLGSACSSRSGLKPAGGTAGSGGTAQGGQAGGVGGTSSAGGVVTGGSGGANGGTSGTSTCLVTECIAGPCVPAGQPRPNLCGCPIRDCEPDGGLGGGIGDACVKDGDCPAGLTCGYLVAGGCATKGVCVQSNCQNGACLTPGGMCGCDGQTILPVQSQQSSANSMTIVYASAPSSGRIGPCMGIPDAGFAADTPTLVCSLTSMLAFGSNGGLGGYEDSFTLDTSGQLTVTRLHNNSMGTLRTCSPTLPACGASGVVSISTIAQDLTDPDVQFAFGLTTSRDYGVVQGPSAGTVWSITTPASAGIILVGSPCPLPNMNSCQPIPAGIQRLADDLSSLAFTAEASSACAGL